MQYHDHGHHEDTDLICPTCEPQRFALKLMELVILNAIARGCDRAMLDEHYQEVTVNVLWPSTPQPEEKP
jgi:hypothetical protein